MQERLYMKARSLFDANLTLRSLIIGALGSAVLTASSLFIALKMGALPWPIVFAVLASALSLRAFGKLNLHEVNVTHAAMSAGAMVAGGLAFTLPALWMSDPSIPINIVEILSCAFGGTLLGLVACALFQGYFICDKKLTYPIGVAAAQTLLATQKNSGRDAKGLFLGMGFAGIWAYVRDSLGLLPQILFSSQTLPGVSLGVMNSPMMISLGFIIGPVMAGVLFLGALIGNFGIVVGFPALALTDLTTAENIRLSLGLGLMFGVGIGIVASNCFAALLNFIKSQRGIAKAVQKGETKSDTSSTYNPRLSVNRIWILVISTVCSLIGIFAFNLSIPSALTLIATTWFCIWLAAWLTGTCGVNPMELFGVVVLLLIQFLFQENSLKTLFLSAGVVAVACGIAGDVMCDLKAGDILKTNPRSQFFAMVVGGIVGAVVSSFLLMSLYMAFGPESFGPTAQFVSAQASVVAAMAHGIPHTSAFIAGIGIGIVLTLLKLPVMTLGLGVYLPFFISAAAFIGAVIRIVFDKLHAHAENSAKESYAQAIASGVLGGESLVGVLFALIAFTSMFG